jgi:hypothetical protein
MGIVQTFGNRDWYLCMLKMDVTLSTHKEVLNVTLNSDLPGQSVSLFFSSPSLSNNGILPIPPEVSHTTNECS